MSGPLILAAGRLQVEFVKRQDRFAHRVALCEGDQISPLLESLEGMADERWPASPPLQELHIEPRAGHSAVALLVGMAGTSHWSASIETDPARELILFDVACRLRGPAGELGSHYVCAQEVRLESAGAAGELASAVEIRAAVENPAAGEIGAAVEIDAASARLRLQIDRGDNSSDVVRLAMSGGRLAVDVGAAAEHGARTIRWKYSIRVLGG